MAKKARKKLEEAEPAFEFPEFDEGAFVWKEYEMASAMWLAALFTVALGLASWALTAAGIPWQAPLALGFGGIVGSMFLIQRLRPLSHAYTKGDWAGLVALEFFGWLALWFVLVNISSTL